MDRLDAPGDSSASLAVPEDTRDDKKRSRVSSATSSVAAQVPKRQRLGSSPEAVAHSPSLSHEEPLEAAGHHTCFVIAVPFADAFEQEEDYEADPVPMGEISFPMLDSEPVFGSEPPPATPGMSESEAGIDTTEYREEEDIPAVNHSEAAGMQSYKEESSDEEDKRRRPLNRREKADEEAYVDAQDEKREKATHDSSAVQKSLINADLERAKQVLKIGDKDMEELFRNILRIPHHPEQLPLGSGHHSASSITCKVLEGHGWQFLENKKWGVRETTCLEPYKPLNLQIDLNRSKGWMLEPPIPQQKDNVQLAHREVVAFLVKIRKEIETDKHKLQFPEDWKVQLSNLSEPELPEELLALIPEDSLEPALANSTMREVTPSPSEAYYGYTPDATPQRGQGNVSKQPGEDSSTSFSWQALHQPPPASSESPTRQVTTPAILVPSTLNEDASNRSKEEAAQGTKHPRNTERACSFIEREGLSMSIETAKLLHAKLPEWREDHRKQVAKHQFTNIVMEKMKGDRYGTTIDFVERDELLERERTTYAGSPVFNSESINDSLDVIEQASRWLNFKGLDTKEVSNEAMVRSKLEHIFCSVFDTELFKQKEGPILQALSDLRLFATVPTPDIAAVPRVDAWGTSFPPHWMFPCNISADWKFLQVQSVAKNKAFGGSVTDSTRSAPSGDALNKWPAQLAMNSMPSLNTMILLHLDTRAATHDPLPSWMYLYAFVFTQYGFVVYCHFPRQIMDNGEVDGWRWGYSSVVLTRSYARLFEIFPVRLSNLKPALQMLYRARSHSQFVANQVEAWATARGQLGMGTIDRFLARIKLQQGEITEVIRLAEISHNAA